MIMLAEILIQLRFGCIYRHFCRGGIEEFQLQKWHEKW